MKRQRVTPSRLSNKARTDQKPTETGTKWVHPGQLLVDRWLRDQVHGPKEGETATLDELWMSFLGWCSLPAIGLTPLDVVGVISTRISFGIFLAGSGVTKAGNSSAWPGRCRTYVVHRRHG